MAGTGRGLQNLRPRDGRVACGAVPAPRMTFPGVTHGSVASTATASKPRSALVGPLLSPFSMHMAPSRIGA